MKPVATTNFNLSGKFYEKGDEVDIKSQDELIRLNEKGFIRPLTAKEIQNWNKEEKPVFKNLRKKED